MSILARLYIVRHGETEENALGIIQGQLDTKLNETGILQARLVGQELKDIPFKQAFASDLERAWKTAEVMLEERLDHVPLERQELLRERHLGQRQGQPSRHGPSRGNAAGTGSSAAAAIRAQGISIENDDRGWIELHGENATEFRLRTLAWWYTAIVRLTSQLDTTHEPLNILTVTHSAFIHALVDALVDGGYAVTSPQFRQGKCWNTSVTILELRQKPRDWVLTDFGSIPHLNRWKHANTRQPRDQGESADLTVSQTT